MQSCRSLARRKNTVASFAYCSRRWVSHDKSELTPGALRQRIQSGLGDSVRLSEDGKAISSEHGSLPTSPIFDPAWVKSHQRERKGAVDKDNRLNRFRRKLVVNPYAQALGTPIRQCTQTGTHLPKGLLQDWEVVKHPETGSTWIAPGPQAFESVEPVIRPYHDIDAARLQEEEPGAPSTNDGAAPEAGTISGRGDRPRRAPITSYTINSQSFVEYVSKKGTATRIIAKRRGLGLENRVKASKWRSNMSDILLKMLRQEATNGLLHRSKRERPPLDKFIAPCKTWDEIDRVSRKMSILWLPENLKHPATRRWATLDREGASYDQKLAVYNLHWLLGPENVQLLRHGSEMFQDYEILVLRYFNSHSMRKLHQLLWRLQGYLDKEVPEAAASQSGTADG